MRGRTHGHRPHSRAYSVFILGLVVAFPLLMVFVVVPRVEEHNARQWALQREAEERAAEVERLRFASAFQTGDLSAIARFCRSEIEAILPYTHWAMALSAGPDRLDAFVHRSQRLDSLHRFTCSPDGIAEARLEHPLATAIRARQAAALEAESGVENADYRSPPELWGELLAKLQRADAGVRRIELVVLPGHEAYLTRWTRRQDGDVVSTTEPADVPEFPSLASDLPPPDGLAQREATRWSASVDAAFELLRRELPPDARIAQARFDDDGIRLALRGPMPGLAAAYGSIEFDAYGEIVDWLYPYDEPPGFGCATGIELAELRRRFDAACARLGCRPESHFSIADYACGQGREQGAWSLYLQSY